MTKRVLARASAPVTDCRSVEREHAGAAAFHLLEVDAAADVAQEEQAFQRLDVGAGGDHVHGDGDAELRRGAELLDQRLGLFVALGLGVVGLVGDLLGRSRCPCRTPRGRDGRCPRRGSRPWRR